MLMVHQGGLWSPGSTWSTLINSDPHFLKFYRKCGPGWIRVDQDWFLHFADEGVDIPHRGSGIQQLSITEVDDGGENARCGEGAVGSQPSEWILAVTEQRDETSRGERRGTPNNCRNYG